MEVNELSVEKQIVAEVIRYKKFHKMLLGEMSDTVVSDIDVKEYVKFLLKDGSMEEKREIIACFNSQILFKNKVLLLQK